MELLKRLELWGCDINGARNRFLDDDELYADCIRVFVSDENFALLNSSFAKQSYKNAYDYAHSLKGVCANLGLTPLYNALYILTEKMRSGKADDLQQYYCDVQQRYKEFCDIYNSVSCK